MQTDRFIAAFFLSKEVRGLPLSVADLPVKLVNLSSGGVRRHCKKATVVSHAGTDWFHHIRLSVLQHLWQTRNECWVKDHHSTAMDICKRVAKDIVSRLLVESSTGKAPMAAALVLRPGATYKTARPRDFQDLSLW